MPAREGEGKSSGYRSIIIIKYKTKAFFVYGFPKNKRGNLNLHEEEEFKEMARHLLSTTEKDLSKGLDQGKFVEVKKDGKKI